MIKQEGALSRTPDSSRQAIAGSWGLGYMACCTKGARDSQVPGKLPFLLQHLLSSAIKHANHGHAILYSPSAATSELYARVKFRLQDSFAPFGLAA